MKRWLLTTCIALKLTGLGLVWLTPYTLLGWLLFLAGGCLFLAHLLAPNWQGVCRVASRFQPEGREVWLTIDDGPDPEDTPRLLALLAEHQAQATFFLVGQYAKRHPELVAAIREAGHGVGCHTHTHPTRWFWLMGRASVEREIDDALPHLGGSVSLFRSPVGIKNIYLARCLAERGLRFTAWTLRSGDGVGRDAKSIAARVRRQVAPGSIILMHEGPAVHPSVRIEAIRSVLEDLTADGYRFILPTEEQLLPADPDFSTTPPTTTKELLCN